MGCGLAFYREALRISDDVMVRIFWAMGKRGHGE